MADFQRGDIVRRKPNITKPGSYAVGEDDFTVIAIDTYGFIIDSHRGEHHPQNLDLVRSRDEVEETPAVEGDPVEQPSHYKQGGLEAIDVIEAFDLSRDFRLGNAAKYLLRAGKKDQELQDLRKARQYLNRYISSLEGTPTW